MTKHSASRKMKTNSSLPATVKDNIYHEAKDDPTSRSKNKKLNSVHTKKRKKQKNKVNIPQRVNDGIPRSFIVVRGHVDKKVRELKSDLRAVMEPFGARNLREKRSNRLQDFVGVAHFFGVSHILLLSQGNRYVTLKLAKIPHGPTLSFQVVSFSCASDIRVFQKHQRSSSSVHFLTPPLLVLNGFHGKSQQPQQQPSFPVSETQQDDTDQCSSSDEHSSQASSRTSFNNSSRSTCDNTMSSEDDDSSWDDVCPGTKDTDNHKLTVADDNKREFDLLKYQLKIPQLFSHMKLVISMLCSLFPPIDIRNIKIDECRRVVLFNYDKNRGSISFRHYAVVKKLAGTSRPVSKLLDMHTRRKMVNMSKVKDIADYILAGHEISDISESELDDYSEIQTDKVKTSRILHKTTNKIRISLVELGPRMQLLLTKVEDNLCSGKVLFHHYIKKTTEEIRELENRIATVTAKKREEFAKFKKAVEKQKQEKALKIKKRITKAIGRRENNDSNQGSASHPITMGSNYVRSAMNRSGTMKSNKKFISTKNLTGRKQRILKKYKSSTKLMK